MANRQNQSDGGVYVGDLWGIGERSLSPSHDGVGLNSNYSANMAAMSPFMREELAKPQRAVQPGLPPNPDYAANIAGMPAWMRHELSKPGRAMGESGQVDSPSPQPGQSAGGYTPNPGPRIDRDPMGTAAFPSLFDDVPDDPVMRAIIQILYSAMQMRGKRL